MECAVITTYRCNARCKMCHIWKEPSRKEDEFTPDILEKIPGGMQRLNITGGEPMLRKDIEDIVAVLDKKTSRLEISTNGYFTERIVNIAKKFPDITIRVSIEGLPKANDTLRGIKNGFDHGIRTILRLKDMGIKDIGFAIVVSDRNAKDLLDLYHLASLMDIEFSQSVMHNSFYFHKHSNYIEDIEFLKNCLRDFIVKLLKSRRKNLHLRVKDWFRAYINLGLLKHVQGKQRLLPCGAATNSFFLDPWGYILACNGSDEPWIIGDLKKQDFHSIWQSSEAEKVRELVRNCNKNCWMSGSAVPAMRENIWKSALWVLKNKINLVLGKDIDFD